MTKASPIRTEAEYDAALARIDELIDAPDGSPEYEELNVIADVVERYEDVHHTIDPPTPIGAVLYYMDQRGLCERDLVPWLGDEATVAAVLAGERPLTLPMMRALHERLGIPADVLLREPA